MTDKIDTKAPEMICANDQKNGRLGWHYGYWSRGHRPKDADEDWNGVEYIRADIHETTRQRAEKAEAERYAARECYDFQIMVSNALRRRAEKAEAERDSYRKTANGMAERAAQAEARAEKAEAKRDEYHAVGNAYAEWAGDILDLLNKDRIDALAPDSLSEQQLRTLIDRAKAGIAAETRRAMRKEGDEND